MKKPLEPQRASPLKDIPFRLRPREEMERLGVSHVPEEVLIAVLLRSGVRGINVLDLARNLLNTFGSLTELAKATTEDLAGVRGMGRVKAQVLSAALELSRRLAEEQIPANCVIRKPEDAAKLLRDTARTLDREVFWIVLLDSRNRMKRPPCIVSSGLLDSAQVHPREVFREAIKHAAAAVVLAHNHPSGDTCPSGEDIRITKQLVEAGRTVSIPVLDHVIIGNAPSRDAPDWFSLRESGLVAFA